MPNALIIVDPQNDFCEGGSLQVSESNQIFQHISKLRKQFNFDHVFITQDWHPENHISFAKNHGLNPFTKKEINGKEEVLWPVHCVQNSQGSQLSPLLELDGKQIYVKKGIKQDEQQYSGFGTKKNPPQLEESLRKLNIDEIYVAGLALDYCVGCTALDAKKAGFNVTVIRQCTRGVSPESCQKMLKLFENQGINYKNLDQII